MEFRGCVTLSAAKRPGVLRRIPDRDARILRSAYGSDQRDNARYSMGESFRFVLYLSKSRHGVCT